MTRIRVNSGAVGAWLFGLAVAYLAGMSLSGVLFYAFLLYLSFPLLAFFFLLAAFARFRYFEYFSTDHPAKGEAVTYRLTLTNESPLPGAFVDVNFLAFGPASTFRLEGISTALRRRESLRREYTIAFPFRGVYKVGMERLQVSDALSWFAFRAEVWYRTFYVYPRVVELERVFSALQNSVETSGQGRGLLADYTLFTGLREYRPGDSVRHLAWKKFAAAGRPFLKEYETTSWPGVELYLDLRRSEEPGPAVLEREDCSIEILVALYNHFLKRNVPVQAHAANGRERFDFSGSGPAAFARFYKATIAVDFEGDVSPVRVFESDRYDRRAAASTVVVVTHAFDPDLVELAAPDRGTGALSVFVVVNQSGADEAEKERQRAYLRARPGLAARLVFVERPEAIKESLER
ncbi:MAG: DUF58 domain-containing protein [Spirochaetales bacterium]|nr:DUF58 domain-containing protein [Spirochaetales bacterium]